MKKFVAILLVLVLTLSLCGCDMLDYKKAMNYYESGDYAAAEELFVALGDYEDSAQMARRCRYETAIALMGKGNYAAAAEIFAELGSFEDAAQNVHLCHYKIAEIDFENGNYQAAAEGFEVLGNYEDSEERAKEARFQQLYCYILEEGENIGENSYAIKTVCEDILIYLYAATDVEDVIRLYMYTENNLGIATFTYDVMLSVGLGDEQASLIAETDMVVYFGYSTGTNTSEYTGVIDIASFDRNSQITLTAYSEYGRDIYGNYSSTDDLGEALTQDLHTHTYELLDGVVIFLQDLNLGVELSDLGFDSWS